MIRTVGVVVPAANEQGQVGACLAALTDARRHLHRAASGEVDVRVVVVLDRCVDETAAVVAAYAGVDAVRSSAGRVGAARAAGVRHLLAASCAPREEIWLANTDADSVVPRDWLVEMLHRAERGAALVLGTVLPCPDLAPALDTAWRARHVLREDHPHVHGANFGIRADVYTRLGGWPDLAAGEDVVLAERAAAAGHLRIARTSTIPVLTSTRLCGRAPRGFSSYLRGLALEAV